MINQSRLIHALSMEMIANAILYGKCSVQYADGNELLVINAPVSCSTNDTDINEWISAHSEIKLVFGYPPEGTTASNDPFVLFHAMIHNPEVGRNYIEKTVDSVEAFLAPATSTGTDEQTLHFRIHLRRKIALPAIDELFETVQPTLIK